MNPRFGLLLVCLAPLAVACGARVVVGEPYGTGDPAGGGSASAPPPLGSSSPVASETSWDWISPRAGGDTLRGITGTSAADVWLVGEHGTVLHYDGKKVDAPVKGAATDSFYAVCSTGPADVWIAGDGPGSQSRVLHFDGATWSSDYSLTEWRVHALFGKSATEVYAAADDGAVGTVVRWDGRSWTNLGVYDTATTLLPPGTFVRDVWAADGADPWIVGDRGLIGGPQYGSYGSWGRSSAADPSSPSDPFAEELSYVSVWGPSANDVFAMFVAADGIGFSHYDGTAWRVVQRGAGYAAATKDFAAQLARGPLRQGRLLGGTAGTIVASQRFVDLPAYRSFSSGWSPELVYYEGAFVDPHAYPLDLAPNEDLTNKRAFWGDHSGHLFAAADFGGFLAYDAGRKPMWHGSAQAGVRFDLANVAPLTDDVAYATDRSGRLAQWNVDGWTEIPFPAITVAPYGSTDPVSFQDVFARSRTDVWAAGLAPRPDGGYDPKFYDGYVAHFDGTAWTTSRIEDAAMLTGIWAIAANDVWAVGMGPPYDWTLPSLVVYHFDGAAWNKVAVPDSLIAVYPSSPGTEGARVFALGHDQVWVTGILVGEQAPQAYVLQWDGTRLAEVYRGDHPWETAPRLWGSSANDLWLPATPALHFDGAAWRAVTAGTDRGVDAIFGASPTDVWAVGTGTLGGAIRRFEGGVAKTALDTSPRLRAIAKAPDGRLWAVGEGGATLRLTTKTTTR